MQKDEQIEERSLFIYFQSESAILPPKDFKENLTAQIIPAPEMAVLEEHTNKQSGFVSFMLLLFICQFYFIYISKASLL